MKIKRYDKDITQKDLNQFRNVLSEDFEVNEGYYTKSQLEGMLYFAFGCGMSVGINKERDLAQAQVDTELDKAVSRLYDELQSEK